MTYIIYFIAIIIFILFLIFGPNSIRNGYIKQLSDEYYNEPDTNSLNETAGNLIAKYIYLHNMDTSICVEDTLFDGDGWYGLQQNEIHIGKEVDKSKNIYAITECYHELGHAKQMQKFNNPRRKLDYIKSLKQKRDSIPYLSVLGMFFIMVGFICLIPKNPNIGHVVFCLIFGIAFILWVLSIQISQVKDESEASKLAIEMMIEDGFTSLEIEKAQKRLDKFLNTYKMELIINALKWLGVVLFMVITSEPSNDNERN